MEGETTPTDAGPRAVAFRIGDHLIEPQRNRISGPSGAVTLQPRIVDVLCALAERQGEVLSRAELIDLVWGVEHGGDESLTRAISQLRKAFGDTRGTGWIIETIAKRGYRLAVPVSPAGTIAGNGAIPARTVSKRFAIGAVLVLALIAAALFLVRPADDSDEPVRSERTGLVVTVEPFASDDPTLATEGLADELATAISRSPLVRVRAARTAPPAGEMRYRLRGEIHRVGSRLSINAQLLDAATGELAWGERYERPYDSQFSAREQLVAGITRDSFYPLLAAAREKLARRPVLSLEPWALTLLVTWVPGSERMFAGPPTEDAYWLQRRALELDPDFAPAHALFAQLASWHALFDPPSATAEARARAQQHADRAIELAPYDPELLYQLALYYQNIGNRERAQAMLGRVLELQPDHPLARLDRHFLSGQCQSDSDAAVAQLEREAATLPATNAARWVALSHLSSLYLARGDFVRARTAALASRDINPGTRPALTLAAADAELGRNAEALATLAAHRREWPNLDLDWFAETVVPRWCLGGPRTAQVQASFRKLALVSASAS